jgi:resuscitation-promoting factor RpfB
MARYYAVPPRLRMRVGAGRSGPGATVAVALVALVAAGAVAPHAAHALAHHPVLTDAAPAPVLAGSTATLGPAASEALANQLATARGWGAQTGCLDALLNRESGFQYDIANPETMAFGEAQALGHDPSGANAAIVPVVRFPGGSTARNVRIDQYPSRAANSGDAGAQLRWDMGYLAATYGDPCRAWNHEMNKGWY